MLNTKRAIEGPLLSFVFLIFFVCIISNMGWVFENSLLTPNKGLLMANISGGLQNTIQPIERPEVNAKSAISVESNLAGGNKIIFEKDSNTKLPIASLTKLMTALIVVENLDLSREIKISNIAANQTKDPELLKTGETYFAKDLLYAMLVDSDNTASYALSEELGTDKFVNLMNAKAKELGISDTSFSNPTGLGLENFSTTQNLAKLAEYLLKDYPSIFKITTMSEFDFYTVDGKILNKIVSTNELLRGPEDLAGRIVGGKTGGTKEAGGCLLLVVMPINNQGYLINVILNSNDRFGDTKKLINWSNAICN